MIMAAVQGGYTLEEMHMSAFHLNVRAGYYRVIVYMVAVLGGITGNIVDMPAKIRIFGGNPGKIVDMSGGLAGLALIVVRVQFIIHVSTPSYQFMQLLIILLF